MSFKERWNNLFHKNKKEKLEGVEYNEDTNSFEVKIPTQNTNYIIVGFSKVEEANKVATQIEKPVPQTEPSTEKVEYKFPENIPKHKSRTKKGPDGKMLPKYMYKNSLNSYSIYRWFNGSRCYYGNYTYEIALKVLEYCKFNNWNVSEDSVKLMFGYDKVDIDRKYENSFNIKSFGSIKPYKNLKIGSDDNFYSSSSKNREGINLKFTISDVILIKTLLSTCSDPMTLKEFKDCYNSFICDVTNINEKNISEYKFSRIITSLKNGSFDDFILEHARKSNIISESTLNNPEKRKDFLQAY